MRILPINNFCNTKKQSADNPLKKTITQSFGHHKDFHRLMQDYEVTASSYFRRGSFYGSPCEKFTDIIDALKLFFKRKMSVKNPPKTMLIGGIGQSQEPFSLLAVIKNLIGKKKLEKILDLNIVDLQSKPAEKELFYQSFYDSYGKPRYVSDSFIIEDNPEHGCGRLNKYRVCDEIYNYLSSVYSNETKSQWETRLQDAVKTLPDESIDIVSINNTIGYVNNYEEGMDIVKNIYRALKTGGIFITDPEYRQFRNVFSPEVSDEIYEGIYRKK